MIQRIAVFLAVVGVVVGVALSLVPVPAQGAGTCGPGTTSESAIGLMFDPASADGNPVDPTPVQQVWIDYCHSLASTQVTISAVVAGASILLGLVGAWLFRPPRAAQ